MISEPSNPCVCLGLTFNICPPTIFKKKKQALESTLGQALDLGALCITPGRFVWTVFLDVMVLEGQGSLIDAVGTLLYALAWVFINPLP